MTFSAGDDNTSSKNLPPRTETDFDENGIKTIVEYRVDEQGKKIKVGGGGQRLPG